MKALILLLLLPLIASCASKYALDAEVKRLCAVDGGIKVYETVTLPPEKFDQWNFIKLYDPTQGENTLGPEYLFKRDQLYYRKGNPEMSRIHYRIFRRSDGKLLGETISYVRGGGDFFYGPSHGSSFACPPHAEAGGNALLKKIFIPSQDRE